MKHEWRKAEKEIYLPKEIPTLIEVPTYKYYVINGEGNPNGEAFGKQTEALYAMSYGIKMMPKRGTIPEGYFDYTVYPLEGQYTLGEKAFANFKENGGFQLEELIYRIMIRQPDFVTKELALDNKETVSTKKPNPYNEQVNFEEITDGLCVQMLHKGPYSEEAKTFTIMETFCKENQLVRIGEYHREIYLSDPRRSKPENNKTVLRFAVKRIS